MPITCYYQAFLIYLIGGYKHALAVLMWIHRRSEDPAPTEVACYWKKSCLSSVGTRICRNQEFEHPKNIEAEIIHSR